MTIHHATLAKAAKFGVTVTEAPADNVSKLGAVVCGHWAEKNKRGYAAPGGAPGLVEDMRAWQTLAREYPHLKVAQPFVADGNFVWEIELRGKVVGEGARLADALDDAMDALAPKSVKKIVAVNGASDEEDGDDEDEGEDNGDDAGELDAAEDDEGEGEEDAGKSVVKRKYKSRYRPFKQTCGDELAQLISKHVKVKDPDDGKMRIDARKLEHFAKRNGVWETRYKDLNIGMRRMNIANRLRAKVRKDDFEVIWN